jgi:hypothetical protein
MSLGRCLADLRSRKLISAERADALQGLYDELVQQYEPRYGRAAAESMATEKALDAADAEHLHRKRQALLQAEAQGRIVKQARGVYAGGKFAEGPINRRALRAHLVRDEHANGIKNVEMQGRVLLNEARRLNYDLLAHFRRGVTGRIRHKADQLELAKALHGEEIEDVNLREMADAAKQTNEWLRSRFNAAGGRIAKLEDWGLPHSWDAYRVGQLTREQFADAVIPELDRARMIDRATGEPMSDARLRAIVTDAYEAIVSEGQSRREPSGAKAGKAVANRRTDHRVLHFQDAEAWMRVNDRFGTATVYDALLGHWEHMARDIAAMEVLGPNPAATVRWMSDLLDNEAKTKGGAGERAQASVGAYEFDKLWAELSGANMHAVRPNLAMIGSTVRNFEVGSKLGGAVISALSDHATRATTRAFNGMPVTRMAGQYLQQIMPLYGDRAREFARRKLIISDEYAGRMAGIGRMHLDDAYGGRLRPGKWDARGAVETGYEVSRRLSDAMMRMSGLSAHTIAGREVAAMEFVDNLTFHAGDAFDALQPEFRAMLQRHGIGAGKWDLIRQSPRTQWRGADWLLPENIADRDLREQVLRAQFMEVDRAIPTAGAYQAALMKGAPPGTVLGELTRFSTQFKMFPVTIVAQHGNRMAAIPTNMGRAKYAATFLGSTTLMGMMAVQLYELANGRDPLPMDDPGTWGKALLKAGGLGIFGDVIKMSQNEYGQTFGNLTVGPAASTADNLAHLGWAAGQNVYSQLFGDDDAQTDAADTQAKALRNVLRREVPLVGMFYTRLAYERLLVDTIYEMTAGDPAAVQRTYRATEQYAEQQGNQYYAAPGSGADWRAPDFGALMGGGEAVDADAGLPEAL